MTATQVQFKIECEGDKVLLVMDKKQDQVIMDWQSAKALGDTIALAVAHLVKHMKPVDRSTSQWELQQVKLIGHKGRVAMLTPWTDRIKFTSLQAFALLGQGLQKIAHDMDLEEQDIHVVRDEAGFIQAISNKKTGITQRVS